jgi:hypothetical protein
MARLTYTKAERLRKAAAESLLTDQAAPAAAKATALKELSRLETAARKRQQLKHDRMVLDYYDKQGEAGQEPSVDALVQQLETAQPPEKPVQKAVPEALEHAVEPPVPPTAPDLACSQCHQVGPWADRYNGRPICHGCMCDTMDIHRPGITPWTAPDPPAVTPSKPRAQSWETVTPVDLAILRGVIGGRAEADFAKSQEIWAEIDRQDADRREQEARERDRAEAAYHAARADFLANGGRL